MGAFILACFVAIAIAAGASVSLNLVQKPVDKAFVSTEVRLSPDHRM
jgi:hypothetical protein